LDYSDLKTMILFLETEAFRIIKGLNTKFEKWRGSCTLFNFFLILRKKLKKPKKYFSMGY